MPSSPANKTLCVDLPLSQRLERAEGLANRRHVEAKQKAFPGTDAESIEVAGAYAMISLWDTSVKDWTASTTTRRKMNAITGGFTKGYLGLGYDFGDFTVGASVSKLKFRKSIIDSTQANLFMEIPYSYLTGPFSGHGQPLPPGDDRRAAQEMGENMLSLTLDVSSARLT